MLTHRYIKTFKLFIPKEIGIVRKYILFLALFLSFLSSFNQVPSIHGTNDIFDLSKEVSYLHDTSSKMSLNDAKQAFINHEFQSTDQLNGNNLGYSEVPVWLHLSFVVNKTDDWVFHLENSYAEHLDLYFIKNGVLKKITTGNKTPFETRNPLNSLDYAYPLGVERGDSMEVFAKISTHSPIIFPILVRSASNFIRFVQYRNLFYGLFFGVMFVMLFYNAFIAFTLKDRAYWIYCLMVLSSILVFAGESGCLFKFIMPEATWLSPLEKKVTIPIMAVTSSLFALTFLQMKVYSRLIYYSTLVLITFGSFITIYSMFFEVYGIASKLITIQAPIILIFGFVILFKGNKDARLYLVAWGLYLSLGAAMTLRNLGILPPNLVTNHGAEFGSVVEVVLLSLALALRIKKITQEKRNLELQQVETIRLQNQQLDSLVEKRTEELQKAISIVHEQNDVLTEKDRLVTSGLMYAKKIQETFLPSLSSLKFHYRDVVWVFEPRDIVSGDFLFFEQKNKIEFIAVADCTGHGVPGALMSILGHNLLYDAVMVMKLTSPSDILEYLDYEFKARLKTQNENIRDGMEIGLCVIDRANNKITFAGAGRPMLVKMKSQEFKTLKKSKRGIGGDEFYYGNTKYEEHSLKLSEIEWIYLFTDGYQDQFGGPNDTKFLTKNFIQLISQNSFKSGDEQYDSLKQSFIDWKGKTDQIDDILVLGVQL